MSEDERARNLELWAACGETNPKFTKQVDQKGGFTSINPYYQIELATGLWGAYGKAWGLRNIERDFSILDSTGLMNYKAEFFCPETTFEINNSVMVRTVKGRVDEDFMMKVETKTLTKALSKIGFNHDVFQAQFDDANYVAERMAEVELEQAEDKDKLKDERFKEIQKDVENSIATMKALPTTVTVDNMRNKTLTNARRKLNTYKFNPQLFDERINKAAEARISEIRASQSNDNK